MSAEAILQPQSVQIEIILWPALILKEKAVIKEDDCTYYNITDLSLSVLSHAFSKAVFF